MGKLSTKFDFLVNLHKTNPEAFDDYQKEVIEEYIQSLPEDRQLKARQTQWVLNGELAKCENPEDRIELLAGLMVDILSDFSDALVELSEVAVK